MAEGWLGDSVMRWVFKKCHGRLRGNAYIALCWAANSQRWIEWMKHVKVSHFPDEGTEAKELLMVAQLASGSPEICTWVSGFQSVLCTIVLHGPACTGSRNTCWIGGKQKPLDILLEDTWPLGKLVVQSLSNHFESLVWNSSSIKWRDLSLYQLSLGLATHNMLVPNNSE